MEGFSFQHILLILVIILLLFGGKKIPELMKGIGQGIKQFKDGMSGDDHDKKPENTATKSSSETEKQ